MECNRHSGLDRNNDIVDHSVARLTLAKARVLLETDAVSFLQAHLVRLTLCCFSHYRY